MERDGEHPLAPSSAPRGATLEHAHRSPSTRRSRPPARTSPSPATSPATNSAACSARATPATASPTASAGSPCAAANACPRAAASTPSNLLNSAVMRLKIPPSSSPAPAGELTRDERRARPLARHLPGPLRGPPRSARRGHRARRGAGHAALRALRIARRQPGHPPRAPLRRHGRVELQRAIRPLIFGTATGDKNVDKILAALRQAGRGGDDEE